MVKISIAKKQAIKLIKLLPDDSTIEDIQYHLYVLEKVEQGIRAIDEGRVVSFAGREGMDKLVCSRPYKIISGVTAFFPNVKEVEDEIRIKV